MERLPHIHFGPGKLFTADGRELADIQEASFENITTIAAPDPTGDIRVYSPSFLNPIELSMDVRIHRRMIAYLLVNWKAKGPIRWIGLDRAKKLKRRRRKKVELF